MPKSDTSLLGREHHPHASEDPWRKPHMPSDKLRKEIQCGVIFLKLDLASWEFSTEAQFYQEKEKYVHTLVPSSKQIDTWMIIFSSETGISDDYLAAFGSQ